MKLEKIELEMQKTREKITALQTRLKELDAQRSEQENLQIVQLVRSLRLSPQQLKAYLQGAAEQPAPVMADSYTGYTTTEQEDSEDEE